MIEIKFQYKNQPVNLTKVVAGKVQKTLDYLTKRGARIVRVERV